jgi:FlaA1/EpsC-like NDP-sugar epimerase
MEIDLTNKTAVVTGATGELGRTMIHSRLQRTMRASSNPALCIMFTWQKHSCLT